MKGIGGGIFMKETVGIITENIMKITVIIAKRHVDIQCRAAGMLSR
jgi:hypothetical protein